MNDAAIRKGVKTIELQKSVVDENEHISLGNVETSNVKEEYRLERLHFREGSPTLTLTVAAVIQIS